MLFTYTCLIIAFAAATFIANSYIKIMSLAVMGLMHMKSTIATGMIVEMLPKSHHNISYTTMFIYECTTIGASCAYYKYVAPTA